MISRIQCKRFFAVAACLLVAEPLSAANMVLNPSFEDNQASFTAFPGYISTVGNAPISNWSASDNSRVGINGTGGSGVPFANNGTVPDGVAAAFVQSAAGNPALSQTISGLVPGQSYLVSARLNSRSGYTAPTLTMTMGTSTFLSNQVINAVGGTNPYYSFAFRHTATTANETLTFTNTNSGADSTLVIDNVGVNPGTSGFSMAAWTGDADSGIQARTAFTQAINVGDTGNTKINGAVFTGSNGSGATNPATNNYTTTGLPNAFAGAATNVTGNSGALLSNFLYGGNPETITLRNLRIGERYITRLYGMAWDAPGARVQNITTSDGGSFVFDQSYRGPGRDGYILSYEFVATSNTQTYTISPNNAGFSYHQYAFSNEMPNYAALLTDNFYALDNPSTVNVNFNLAARQGGYFAGTAYTSAGNQQVGNPTGGVDGGNYLLSASGGRSSPDRNFNGALSSGGQLIAFDVAPSINGGGNGNWTAINLGMSQADRLSTVNSATTHFGILFRGNGFLEAWDGATNLTPTNPVWLPGGDATNGLHRIELLLTDPTDGNPFDGVGQTSINVYADGLLVYTFSKTGGGYANNYINFNGIGIGGIDNLLIARVPEPTSIALFSIGLAGLLGLRRRNRSSND